MLESWGFDGPTCFGFAGGGADLTACNLTQFGVAAGIGCDRKAITSSY